MIHWFFSIVNKEKHDKIALLNKERERIHRKPSESPEWWDPDGVECIYKDSGAEPLSSLQTFKRRQIKAVN